MSTAAQAGAGAGAYPTPHYARASRSLDDILPPAPGSTIAAPAPTPSLGPLPTPGLPQSPRNLRILPVQSKLSNSDLIFKNDAIFKIKSTEAYLAPPDQLTHLSFRKGQAFYALNHNDTLKCFFVSTEYATPFSRTAVNGFVPDRYFEVVELSIGKKKANASMNSVVGAKVLLCLKMDLLTTSNLQTQTTTQTNSTSLNVGESASFDKSKASLAAVAVRPAIAATWQDHNHMVQNQQQSQQQPQHSVPSIIKRHSIGATPGSTSAATPNNSLRSGGQMQQQQTIAELEWELKKNTDLSMSHQLSRRSLSNASVLQSGVNNGGILRGGISEEMPRNFVTSLGSAENLSNNSFHGTGVSGALSAQEESASGSCALLFNRILTTGASTVTPTPPRTPPRTPFFSWRTARTPNAPTGQLTAFPYLPWISSGGTTATSPTGSVLHADSDAPPLPQIPAAFRAAAAAGIIGPAGGGESISTVAHVGGGEAFNAVASAGASGGEKSPSSMAAGVNGFGQPIELERKKSNGSLGAVSIGATTISRMKPSLKKSGSSFWLGKEA
ncbi:hypothetical protein HDU84_008273 [Entophlyctis sp. JEL0112]|nr:hypothetical protein HDU84_008273 [Entophlyctis sp. JEL0112]